MVFKCLRGLAAEIQATTQRTDLMLDCHPQIISKIVLVIVAPHCGITFLVRLRARNPSGRSNAQSAKFYKAWHSRKVAF